MRISDFPAIGGRPAHGHMIPSLAGVQRRLFLAAEARRLPRRGTVSGGWTGIYKWVFVGALLVAAIISIAIRQTVVTNTKRDDAPPSWPTIFEGRALTPLPMSVVEQRFAVQFPGRIGRFTDGRRNIILRVVDQPTRLLHPAADCFRGIGYRVEQPRVMQRNDGAAWGCFAAGRDGNRRTVCERIHDGDGHAWTDVSAWYWAATLGRTHGPWWAVTVVDGP